VKYPATFHIGFGQESEEKVNEIYKRLIDDGFSASPPKEPMHGPSMLRRLEALPLR